MMERLSRQCQERLSRWRQCQDVTRDYQDGETVKMEDGECQEGETVKMRDRLSR